MIRRLALRKLHLNDEEDDDDEAETLIVAAAANKGPAGVYAQRSLQLLPLAASLYNHCVPALLALSGTVIRYFLV
jgi:ABC-type molybdate transport system substrate-binding protein